MAQERPGWRDDGSTVLGWLLRITLLLGVLGVVAMDTISVVSTRFQTDDAATTAATAAATMARTTLNRKALANSAAQAIGPAYRLDPARLVVARDGSVTLTVHRTADTVLLHRVGPLAHLAEVTRSATGRSAP